MSVLLTHTQNAFNAGELGILMQRRSDTDQYARGCKRLRNMVVGNEGFVFRRMGTTFADEVKTSSAHTRVIDFTFGNGDAYAMEFGNQYIRFYRNRELVLNTAQNITNITQANPAVVTYSGADTYANGDEVYIDGVVGMTQVNGLRFIVANVNTGANTFELQGINSTGYTAYSSGGTVAEIYQITSPYTTSDLPNIKHDQQGDVMYLTCGGKTHRPQKLVRNADGTFTIANLENLNGPVEEVTQQAITLTASATTGSITITASAALFEAAHVGGLWELRDGTGTTASRGYFRITGFTSSTSVSATVQRTLFGTTASAFWGAASWDGVRGYPRAVALHQQRLVWAGTDEDPLAVYFSKSNGNFENYDYATVLATDGFTVRLTGRVNNIESLVSDAKFLLCITVGGIAAIGAPNGNEALSVSNVEASNGETYGGSSIQAISFASGVKYIQTNGKRLYQAVYDDISLKYRGADLSVLNSNALASGARYLFAQNNPFNILWVVTNDGRLVGFTEETDNKIRAFHPHATLGGEIESGCVVSEGDIEYIYLVIKRTINSTTKRYVEYFQVDTENEEVFTDSCVSYDGTKAVQLTLGAVTGTSISVAAGSAVFAASNVGDFIIADDNGGRATITGFTSSTSVTVNITADFASTTVAASTWKLSANEFTVRHLAGKEVDVRGDGSYVGRFTVASDGTLTVPANKGFGLGYIGIPMSSDIVPTVPRIELKTGDSTGRKMRVARLMLGLYNSSAGFLTGPSEALLKRNPSRSAQDLMNAAVPNVGITEISDEATSFQGNWGSAPDVWIRQDLPAPLTLCSLTRIMEIGELVV